MDASLPFFIASGLFGVFAVLHTVGLFVSRDPPNVQQVKAAMRSERFTLMGVERTLWRMWMGLGLVLTVFLVMAAVLAWHLAALPAADGATSRPIAWLLFAASSAVAVLQWTNFFPAPGVLATLAAAAVGIGAWALS